MVAVAWSAIGILAVAVFGLGAFLSQQIGGLRGEIGGLRSDMESQIGELRSDMESQIGGLRGEIGALRSEVHRLAERQAEMTGELSLLRQMAHTHTAA
ncbi:MAG: hypothetical protein M1115_09315 [Actinobacteria bacterium]|nr:hypothetical protein [Actinomycetota bacterium]